MQNQICGEAIVSGFHCFFFIVKGSWSINIFNSKVLFSIRSSLITFKLNRELRKSIDQNLRIGFT